MVLTCALWAHLRLQDPQKNRYVAHMRCIRWIQDYLVRKVCGCCARAVRPSRMLLGVYDGG